MEIVAEVERRLGELSQLDGEPYRKAACELRAHKACGRYVRQSGTGELRLRKAKVRAEELFDGKFLVSRSDDGLSAEDVALCYKQLAGVERVFRDLKHTVDIRSTMGNPPDALRRGLADQPCHQRAEARLREALYQAAAALLRAPQTTPRTL